MPTAQGYRVFVDSLLQMQPLPEAEVARLRSELPAGGGTQALLGSASELLSAMTHFVGVVSVPKREQFAFRHIDFVPLDGNRVLAILVFADNEVQNRIVQTRRAYDPGELEHIANYLNAHFAGRPLAEIRGTLLHEMRAARSEMETLLSQSVELAEQALAGDGEDMLVAGQTRLIGVQDLSDLDRLRELFEAFARKREILQLLERTVHAPGVRIFIGEETGLAPLEGVSLVTAPYAAGGQVLGVLGVIGPTRMAYERVIPVVQATADVLGAAWVNQARRSLAFGFPSPSRGGLGRTLNSTRPAPLVSGRRLAPPRTTRPEMTNDPMHGRGHGRRRNDPLQAELETLRAELEQLRAQSLLERADLENQRKRLERDVRNACRFANEQLLGDLLPVFDSMEARLATADDRRPAARRHGADPARAAPHRRGQRPGRDRAAVRRRLRSRAPPGHEHGRGRRIAPGAVAQVFQKGYLLNERLLRPALVAWHQARLNRSGGA